MCLGEDVLKKHEPLIQEYTTGLDTLFNPYKRLFTLGLASVVQTQEVGYLIADSYRLRDLFQLDSALQPQEVDCQSDSKVLPTGYFVRKEMKIVDRGGIVLYLSIQWQSPIAVGYVTDDGTLVIGNRARLELEKDSGR